MADIWIGRAGQSWINRVDQKWLNRPVTGDPTRYNNIVHDPPADIYSGDPRLFLDEDGSFLVFRSGQPVMDQGLENLVYIRLFTRSDWIGNSILPTPIGSEFEKAFDQPITLTALNNIRNATIRALDGPEFQDIEVEVANPESYRIDIKITLRYPGYDTRTLIISRNGLNWISQKTYPAYERQ